LEKKNKKSTAHRILVTIVGQGSVTHIVRTGILQNMQSFCTPVVGILWDDESLRNELTELGIENHVFPPFTTSVPYYALRQKINVWYLSKILQSPSTTIQSRYLSQYASTKKNVKNKVKGLITSFKHNILPGYTTKLVANEKEELKKESVFSIYKNWFEALNIDGLYTITPFMQEVELLALICREKNLPIIAAVHSFDNLTKRGWTSVTFDHYIVWNKYNKAELKRIHSTLSDKNITISGAPQFDFHFNISNLPCKEEWLTKMKLPPRKKIILYGGGPATLFPNEPQYLQHLLEAFKNKQLLQDAIILFRSHPLDKMQRWKEATGESEYIVYDKAPNGTIKLDYTNVTKYDVEQLITTLMYTDVHINLCSTMAIDGSVFKKPQIAPAYDEAKGARSDLLKSMYYQEHYLPILKSGNVHLASSEKELIALVNQALQYPTTLTQHADACVKEIITYTDGKSAERVSNKLKEFFS
jgi:hypothetical protein